GTTDGGDRVRRAGAPVGQVAMLGHLEGAEYADVQVPAAHHREGIGVVEIRAAGQQRHRLLAGVDQVRVLLPGLGRGAHAEQAVLALEEHFLVGRQVVGDAGRQADAEVHVGALWDVPGDPFGHLFAAQSAHAAPPVSTTRCTKIPGVTTASGSSSPSGTTSLTWAMVHLAAIAISGPKLRAVLRYTRLPQRSPRCALISAKSACSGYSST